MNEIKKKVKEIKEWADADGRSMFVLLKEHGKHISLANASRTDLTDMLLAAIKENAIIDDVMRDVVILHMVRSQPTLISSLGVSLEQDLWWGQ